MHAPLVADDDPPSPDRKRAGLDSILYFDYHRTMEESSVVQALAALAQPVRLQVFRALVVAGPEGLTPSLLAEGLEVSPSTLSFHLKELSHAGLVAAGINVDQIAPLRQFARNVGHVDVLPPAVYTARCSQRRSMLTDQRNSLHASPRETTLAANRR